MTASQRLRELGIELPTVSAPLAAYVPTKRTGNLLYIAGQGPIVDGRVVMHGKLGRDLDVRQGLEAARLSAINALAAMASAVGDLDGIVQIVKLNGYVNCVDEFEDQHLVINGASELLVEVLGERGRHARAAVGTNALPLNMPVEIELIVEVAPGR
ncbi:RidA family protein [Mesorhizobium sp. CAU 1741]|uniref:RidA family protein n=1 Tax=Mesorhizobium sp. CAU 1741 TaxID=3140366 RepID=UPI00325B7FAF